MSHSYITPGRITSVSFFIGKEHSIEVFEIEPDAEEHVPERESAAGNVESAEGKAVNQSQPETPVLEGSAPVELLKPKMKIFHGRTAPGLRIRSGPSFVVRFCSRHARIVLIIVSILKAEQLSLIKPEGFLHLLRRG